MTGSTEVCSLSFLDVRFVFLILGTIGCSIGLGSSLTMSLTGSGFMTGAGTGAGEELLGESTEVDAGGNRKLPAIGVI